jgi:predicted DNA-binding protein
MAPAFHLDDESPKKWTSAGCPVPISIFNHPSPNFASPQSINHFCPSSKGKISFAEGDETFFPVINRENFFFFIRDNACIFVDKIILSSNLHQFTPISIAISRFKKLISKGTDQNVRSFIKKVGAIQQDSLPDKMHAAPNPPDADDPFKIDKPDKTHYNVIQIEKGTYTMITIRLNKNIEDQLKYLAKIRGSNKSELVREAIDRFLEDNEDLELAQEAKDQMQSSKSLLELRKELGLDR